VLIGVVIEVEIDTIGAPPRVDGGPHFPDAPEVWGRWGDARFSQQSAHVDLCGGQKAANGAFGFSEHVDEFLDAVWPPRISRAIPLVSEYPNVPWQGHPHA